GRAWITITEVSLRVAGRPALGVVVVYIEELRRPDGADGVAPVVGPAQVVPLLADQHHLPLRLDPAGFVRTQDVHQALARHLRVRLEPGQLQVGRGEVADVDEVVHDPAWL